MEIPSGRRSSEPAPYPGPGEAPQQSRHRRHHDRPETQQAGLVDRLLRAFAFLPLGLQGKVDHHDRVLLHNADQQDDADQRDNAELVRQNISASIAPTPAEGSVERIVIGWI